MDELSIYSTLAALILLIISYYWLYKHDQTSNRSLPPTLSPSPTPTPALQSQLKLSEVGEFEASKGSTIIIANCKHKIISELRSKLASLGYIIYELDFTLDQDINLKAANEIQLNPWANAQLKQLAEFIKEEFRGKKLKLLAYINLPYQSDHLHSILCTIQSIRFLVSISGPLMHSSIKFLHIKDSLLPESCNFVNLYTRLGYLIDRILNKELEKVKAKVIVIDEESGCRRRIARHELVWRIWTRLSLLISEWQSVKPLMASRDVVDETRSDGQNHMVEAIVKSIE